MISHTLSASFLPSPVATNTTRRAELINGRVNVTRLGGGFGELSMPAIQLSFSYSDGERERKKP